ncbi:hypothetical protein BDZ45DRAFT_796752 [Acephala macrosclerotiorum]|nr:hypothetical protein BDZ45DRAFT_796752 [Acephala macrosclerotiorum]
MHDPVHTFLDTMLTKKKPISKFKKIREKENREIKRMKDRKAREAAGGFNGDEEFNMPYGRTRPSGAPPGSRDNGLAERLPQQRGVQQGSNSPRGRTSQQFNYQPSMPPMPPLGASGRRSQQFNFLFPGQGSQKPPHSRPHSTTPIPSKSQRGQGRERAVTAPGGQRLNAGMVGLTEYKNQSVLPKTYPKVTETKKGSGSVESPPPSSRKGSIKERSSVKEKSSKKEKIPKKDKGSDQDTGPPLSHYPMSDGASLKTELNRGMGDMRRSFVEGFLPSISSKGKRN